MEHNAATQLHMELEDDDLLGVAYDQPNDEDHRLEEQAESFHERCDEEILAALVAPSF